MSIDRNSVLAVLSRFNSRRDLSNFENGPTAMCATIDGEMLSFVLTKNGKMVTVRFDKPVKCKMEFDMAELLRFPPP